VLAVGSGSRYVSNETTPVRYVNSKKKEILQSVENVIKNMMYNLNL
jgi:hypothetical protein